MAHTTTLHTGQELRFEETDLTIVIVAVYEEPHVLWCGVPLPPFASVRWSDDEEAITSLNIVTIRSQFTDTGV